jgi:hypothetical protein
MLLAPEGCENLPILGDRAIRLADGGLSGDDLQMALRYGDYWIDTQASGEPWPPPVPEVRVQVWVDPSRTLLKAVWDQLSSLRLVPEFDGRVGFGLHYFTSISEVEKDGWALAALAARKQGMETEFLQSLVDVASSIGNESEDWRAAALSQAAERAGASGLDMVLWGQDIGSAELQERLRQQEAQAVALGVRSSPTWFINGYRLRGLQSKGSIQRIISLELLDIDLASESDGGAL